jgi:ElaB/YqjD/DUF883 family membrane-anchored ribosome-binding protein
MNHSSQNDTDAIRSDIDVTRRRMDDTMDALGDRLQPRHLLDEVLGFFRGDNPNGEARLTQIREKVTSSADTAMHAVVDSIKQNPVPALLIGAGVAWMIYESRRDKTPPRADGDYYGYDREGDELRYDPDRHYDRPLQYPNGAEDTEFGAEAGSKLGEIKDKVADKASAAADQVKGKLAQVGEAAREKAGALKERAGETLGAVKQRAGEITDKVKDGTRQAYVATRDRVVTTADQHPLEVGLVALAAGVIAGLAIPTPPVVNRRLGPTADRLRDRTREASSEMMEKGKRVAQAAVSAVKNEAQAQGLTPDKLREKATALADRATEAGKQTARQEGLVAGNSTTPSNPPAGQSQPTLGAKPGDPSVARPAV